MRRARTVRCPSCGAGWDAARARFCGWCGLPLRRPDLPAVDEDAGPRRWPRGVAWTGAGVAAVAALVTVAVLVDGFRLPLARPDPVVELADGEDAVVPRGEPLSAAERAELLAPFDPNRLRCEPEGCEVWRRELVDRQAMHTNTAPLGDLVLVNVGNDITAYDAATGEERWRQRWPATSAARSSANWTSVLPTEDGEHVVLARPDRGDLLVVRRDGSVAWHEDGDDHLNHWEVAGDMLLTSALIPGEPSREGEPLHTPSGPLVVRDLASGVVRWQRDGAAMISASAQVVVAQEGRAVVVLDLATGAEVARRDFGSDPYLYPVGDVLLSYGAEGEQALLSIDLEPLPGMDGLTELYPVPGEPELILALRHGDPDAQIPDQVLLVDGAGRLRWSADLDNTPRTAVLCCPQPHARDGVLVLPATGDDGTKVALSLDDGTRVEVPPSPLDDVTAPGNVWWLTPRTALEHRENSVVLHHDGRRVEVMGQDSWPVTDEPPFVMTNGRSLLAVQPVPDG